MAGQTTPAEFLNPAELQDLADLSALLREELSSIGTKTREDGMSFEVPGVGPDWLGRKGGLAATTPGASGPAPEIFKNVASPTERVNSYERDRSLVGIARRIEAHAGVVNQAEAKTSGGELLTFSEQTQLDNSLKALTEVSNNIDLLDISLRNATLDKEYQSAIENIRHAKEQLALGATPLQAFGSVSLALSPATVGTAAEPDSDPEKARLIRDTIQCWLSYNSPAFARYRMDNTPVDTNNNIAIPGYTSTTLKGTGAAKQRIALVNPPTLGYGLQNKLGYRSDQQ